MVNSANRKGRRPSVPATEKRSVTSTFIGKESPTSSKKKATVRFGTWKPSVYTLRRIPAALAKQDQARTKCIPPKKKREKEKRGTAHWQAAFRQHMCLRKKGGVVLTRDRQREENREMPSQARQGKEQVRATTPCDEEGDGPAIVMTRLCS